MWLKRKDDKPVELDWRKRESEADTLYTYILFMLGLAHLNRAVCCYFMRDPVEDRVRVLHFLSTATAVETDCYDEFQTIDGSRIDLRALDRTRTDPEGDTDSVTIADRFQYGWAEAGAIPGGCYDDLIRQLLQLAGLPRGRDKGWLNFTTQEGPWQPALEIFDESIAIYSLNGLPAPPGYTPESDF